MAVKQHRMARITGVSNRLNHLYDGNTCTGAIYVTGLTVEITDGPDAGRVADVEMTPEDARRWAQQLLDYADRTETLNKRFA